MTRHLHETGEEHTLCGARRRVPVRTGSKVYYEPGHQSVHVTKARKTDCKDCREIFRATRQVLKKALGVMRKYGWTKGQYGSLGGPACLVGAIHEAAWGNRYDPPTFGERRKVDLAISALGFKPGIAAAKWNDAPSNRWPKVKARFERTIAQMARAR